MGIATGYHSEKIEVTAEGRKRRSIESAINEDSDSAAHSPCRTISFCLRVLRAAVVNTSSESLRAQHQHGEERDKQNSGQHQPRHLVREIERVADAYAFGD